MLVVCQNKSMVFKKQAHLGIYIYITYSKSFGNVAVLIDKFTVSGNVLNGLHKTSAPSLIIFGEIISDFFFK